MEVGIESSQAMRQCILAIEDNTDICEAVRYNLEKEKNFSVVEAHTGEEGVSLAFKLKPSLIILDLMLPVPTTLLPEITQADLEQLTA